MKNSKFMAYVGQLASDTTSAAPVRQRTYRHVTPSHCRVMQTSVSATAEAWTREYEQTELSAFEATWRASTGTTMVRTLDFNAQPATLQAATQRRRLGQDVPRESVQDANKCLARL